MAETTPAAWCPTARIGSSSGRLTHPTTGAAVAKFVTVDRRPAVLALSAAPISISPNGDGLSDRTQLRMTADSPVTGSARIVGPTGAGLRLLELRERVVGLVDLGRP